jgi:hypothetical protein
MCNSPRGSKRGDDGRELGMGVFATDPVAMNIASPPFNKRTVLGGQYLLVGAVGALGLESVLLVAALVAVGAYLLFAPALG